MAESKNHIYHFGDQPYGPPYICLSMSGEKVWISISLSGGASFSGFFDTNRAEFLRFLDNMINYEEELIGEREEVNS